MERIRNILGLGLGIYTENVEDRFRRALSKALHREANKLMNSFENLGKEEREISPLAKRADYLGWNEDKAYEKSLRLLAKLRPEYKKYLPRAKNFGISDLLKRKIRLAVWVGTGNQIPSGELNQAKVKNLLKAEGYSYRRNELRWYHGGLRVGKNLFEALAHLEKNKAIDRKSLTISF